MDNYFYIDGKKIPMSEDTAKSVLDSQKQKTYADVADNLFEYGAYYTDTEGDIARFGSVNATDLNNSVTEKQLESILELNKLCNVAKYLNVDWLPKYTGICNNKYVIYIEEYNTIFPRKVSVRESATGGGCGCASSLVYFKTKELADYAIEILGEDSIRKALTLNH